MRVLHISVRLNEGGAARIALDLHSRSLDKKIDSYFCYGYGKWTLKNPFQKAVKQVSKCAGSLSVLLNFLIHKFIGIDPIEPTGKWKYKIMSEIDKSDIVHLHVIHSYYLPYKWLFEYLIKKDKKIVWTIHDYWALTGRCASLDNCMNYKSKCGNCKTHKNYPPSIFDFSKYEYKRKENYINSVAKNLTMVCVSEHLASEHRRKYPNIDVRVILNGVDKEFERILKNTKVVQSDSKKKKVLVIANDLSYAHKTDRKIVEAIVHNNEIELHTVGKNSPFNYPGVVNHGPINSRDELSQIYLDMDCMVFTSTVDTFGLVIIESLLFGVPVIALTSDASKEVLNYLGARTLLKKEMLSFDIEEVWSLYEQKSKETLQNAALNLFSGDKMFNDYLEVYHKLNKNSKHVGKR